MEPFLLLKVNIIIGESRFLDPIVYFIKLAPATQKEAGASVFIKVRALVSQANQIIMHRGRGNYQPGDYAYQRRQGTRWQSKVSIVAKSYNGQCCGLE